MFQPQPFFSFKKDVRISILGWGKIGCERMGAYRGWNCEGVIDGRESGWGAETVWND